jgi:hypothetical protein
METNKIIPPFLLISEDNKVVGISTSERKPMFENEMCEEIGMVATCNGCDRVIFKDEKWKTGYIKNHGYCRQCVKKMNEQENKV